MSNIDTIDFEELNIEVAKLVFGVQKEIIEAWPWGVPSFSSDRRWSSAVVTKMWSGPDLIRQAFERNMICLAESLHIKGGFVEAMIVNTPDEICRAAIKAINDCNKSD